MNRDEAIVYFIENGYGAHRHEALAALGVSDAERRKALNIIMQKKRREFEERMSPDWRGEEMGG